MVLEKTQLKFAKSERNGELIGFVSRNASTNKLKGVREDSRFKKKICLLSAELKGIVLPNVLYAVEMKAMHNESGYVVVAATQVLFTAKVESIVVLKSIYQVTITFGNKVIYFDPKDGKGPSSRTCEGVLEILHERQDINDKECVIEEFLKQANKLVGRMEMDGYIMPQH